MQKIITATQERDDEKEKPDGKIISITAPYGTEVLWVRVIVNVYVVSEFIVVSPTETSSSV